MTRIRYCYDRDECRILWHRLWPHQTVFDEWAVRACFDNCFNREPCFVVAESNGRPVGLVALSWIDEENYFGHFPGETWHGKTWLEQNRIIAQSKDVYYELLGSLPGETRIRYLVSDSPQDSTEENLAVDETGYLFKPRKYEYCFDNYMEEFSRRSRKKIQKELSNLEGLGLSYRFDTLSDFDTLVQLNLESFGEYSYFHDTRFLKSFERLVAWLYNQKLLRIVTVLIQGRVAAVDLGSLLHSEFTVLAGATSSFFPGVAKHINISHFKWACEQKLESVDLLCGDFNWKTRFHLSERPLFEMQFQLPMALGRAVGKM